MHIFDCLHTGNQMGPELLRSGFVRKDSKSVGNIPVQTSIVCGAMLEQNLNEFVKEGVNRNWTLVKNLNKRSNDHNFVTFRVIILQILINARSQSLQIWQKSVFKGFCGGNQQISDTAKNEFVMIQIFIRVNIIRTFFRIYLSVNHLSLVFFKLAHSFFVK